MLLVVLNQLLDLFLKLFLRNLLLNWLLRGMGCRLSDAGRTDVVLRSLVIALFQVVHVRLATLVLVGTSKIVDVNTSCSWLAMALAPKVHLMMSRPSPWLLNDSTSVVDST